MSLLPVSRRNPAVRAAGSRLRFGLTLGLALALTAPLAPAMEEPAPAPAPAVEPAPPAGPDAPANPAADAPAAPAEAANAVALPLPAVADYLPCVALRVNNLAQALADFKAFMNTAAPIAAAEAQGNLIPRLVYAEKLSGIDTAQPVRFVLFAPKQLFTLAADRIQADTANQRLAPVFVHLIALKNEKEYIDQLTDDLDDLKQELPYYSFTNKNTHSQVYVQFVPGFAVFSNEKRNVDIGVLYAKQLHDAPSATGAAPADPAAPANTPAEPTALWEIQPGALAKQTGLDQPDQRKQFLAAMAVIFKFLHDRNVDVGGENANARLRFRPEPKEYLRLLTAVLDAAPSLARIQGGITFSKDHADAFLRMQAADGSDLAKQIAALPVIDSKTFTGLKAVRPVWAVAGRVDLLLQQALEIFLPQSTPDEIAQRKYILELLPAFLNEPNRQVAGFNADNEFEAAAAYHLAEGHDGVKLLDQFHALFDAGAENLKAKNTKLTVANHRVEDGWTIEELTVEPLEAPVANGGPANKRDLRPEEVLFGQVLHLVMLTKDRDFLVGLGETPAQALANAREYFATPAPMPFNEAFQQDLAKSIADRHGVMVGTFQLSPLIGKALKYWLGDEGLIAAAATLDKTNPLAVQSFAQQGGIELQARLDADTVRQYIAFAMKVRAFFEGGGVAKPGNQTPPGGKDDQF